MESVVVYCSISISANNLSSLFPPPSKGEALPPRCLPVLHLAQHKKIKTADKERYKEQSREQFYTRDVHPVRLLSAFHPEADAET